MAKVQARVSNTTPTVLLRALMTVALGCGCRNAVGSAAPMPGVREGSARRRACQLERASRRLRGSSDAGECGAGATTPAGARLARLGLAKAVAAAWSGVY